MSTGMLHLPLKAEYFDAIARGEKSEEYRLRSTYWFRRIEGRWFDGIRLTRGYPRIGDREKWLQRPWKGYTVKRIVHPQFGPDPVEVYAIKVN